MIIIIISAGLSFCSSFLLPFLFPFSFSFSSLTCSCFSFVSGIIFHSSPNPIQSRVSLIYVINTPVLPYMFLVSRLRWSHSQIFFLSVSSQNPKRDLYSCETRGREATGDPVTWPSSTFHLSLTLRFRSCSFCGWIPGGEEFKSTWFTKCLLWQME